MYFNFNLILVLISIILTILVLNLQFRGPKRTRVPRIIRTLIIGCLGRAFGFGYESRAFYLKNTKLNDQTNKKKETKMKKQKETLSSDNEMSEIETCSNVLVSKDQFVYDKFIARKSKTTEQFKYCDSTKPHSRSFMSDVNFDSMPEILVQDRNQKDLAVRTKKSKTSTSFKSDSECSGKNLEKLINKIQKSIDPFKIVDPALKFSILKEVLECQRLLLTANLSANDIQNQAISVDEILDEWKILAMIVDRVCFFIYLMALVLSSVIFFFNEYYADDFFFKF